MLLLLHTFPHFLSMHARWGPSELCGVKSIERNKTIKAEYTWSTFNKRAITYIPSVLTKMSYIQISIYFLERRPKSRLLHNTRMTQTCEKPNLSYSWNMLLLRRRPFLVGPVSRHVAGDGRGFTTQHFNSKNNNEWRCCP